MAANEGWLATSLHLMHLVQMCVQGRWISDSSLLTLPHLEEEHIALLNQALARSRGRGGKEKVGGHGIQEIECLPELVAVCMSDGRFLSRVLEKSLSRQQVTQVREDGREGCGRTSQSALEWLPQKIQVLYDTCKSGD